MNIDLSTYPVDQLMETYNVSCDKTSVKRVGGDKLGQPIYTSGEFWSATTPTLGVSRQFVENTVRAAVEAVVRELLK